MKHNNIVIKYIIFVSIFIFSGVVYGECLSKDEVKYVDSYVGSNKYAHGNELEIIPNYFKCINPTNRLEKYVCKDKHLLNMFQFLARTRINFWERNERHEVDHKSFNDDDIKLWVEKYNTANLNNVCFDLKEQTTNYLGGGAPYLIGDIEGMEDIVFVQTNEHGISLQFNKKILYLGKSCDVIDSLGRKGEWYKSDNKYIINIGDDHINLSMNENIIVNNNCSKKPEPAPKIKAPEETVKHALVTSPPKNAEVVKTKKPDSIKKSASGSISLILLASLLGLLAWRAS